VPDYTVYFLRSARRDLEQLPDQLATRILKKTTGLQKNPRPAGALKLQGDSQLWRIRVGDYRVIYSIDDLQHVVEVSYIRHRRDAYRSL
jgi:mRNA interferase RelE/StbE